MVHRVLKVKYVLFVASSWALLFGLLVFFSGRGDIVYKFPVTDEDIRIEYPKNYLEGVELLDYNLSADEPYAYKISFDSLETNSSTLGTFKTALRREIHIKDFKADVYKYISEPKKETEDVPVSDFSEYRVRTTLDELIRYIRPEEDYYVRLDIDMTNISGMSIFDFEFNHFINGSVNLSIKSKTAKYSFQQSDFLFKGHVVIRSDDKTFECNHVEWDINNEIFISKGVYALNRAGEITSGRDITLDMNLNEITDQQKFSTVQKERGKWYTKSH